MEIWIILTTICFWNTALMMKEDSPICWKDALLPLRYESESSCVLVMKQLSRDLQLDMNNRLVTMTMTCREIGGDEQYEHKDIEKLPLYIPHQKKET